MVERMTVALLIGIVGLLALIIPAPPSTPGNDRAFISSAEAVVGRPLTPVSVAGVARRTARRCAAGVYNC
jgi:hypothetical protein